MSRVLVAFALFFAMAWVPLTQSAASEPRLFLLHDVTDDGYTYVGNINHFGYILQDANGKPTTHENGVIEVVQNGLVLYKTTPQSGHDYDVLNTFQVAFPTSGPYEVKASIPLSGSASIDAVFQGVAVWEPMTSEAKIEIEPKGELVDGTPVEFVVRLTDAATGELIPHSDAVVEVRRPGDNWLVFRTHLHTHDEEMSFHYLFPSDGDYLVRAVGYMAYPEPDAPRFLPVHATKTVSVAPGQAGQGSAGVPQKPTMMPSVRYELQTSIDPQASNTPFSRTVVSGLVFDRENNAYVPHVNFEAWIDEPAGHTIFYSKSLHEYDGLYDLSMNLPYPSRYTLTLRATQGDWEGVLTKDFTIAEVLPTDGLPLITSAGGVVVSATGLDGLKSGTPSRITFSAESFAGTPAEHTEIDFQVMRSEWAPPLLQNKIHTHDTGTFDVDITFPEAGDYLLALDPVTIHGEPTPQYYFGAIGGKLVVPLTVAEGVPLMAVIPAFEAPAPVEPGELPALHALAALGACVVGAVLLHRRP